MTETTRRADDLVRTIAKLQRRVDALPVHSHGITPHAVLSRATDQNVGAGAAINVDFETVVTTRGAIDPQIGQDNTTITVPGLYAVVAVGRFGGTGTGVSMFPRHNLANVGTVGTSSGVRFTGRNTVQAEWVNFLDVGDTLGAAARNHDTANSTSLIEAFLTVTRIGN